MEVLTTDNKMLERLFLHDSQSAGSLFLSDKEYSLNLFSIYWADIEKGYRIFQYGDSDFFLLKLKLDSNSILRLEALYKLNYTEVINIKNSKI